MSKTEDMEADWRKRFARAVEAAKANGLSAREISLRAGKGPGYVHSILKEGNDPSITNMAALCKAMNISLGSIVVGFEIDRETERLLRALDGDTHRLKAILQLLAVEEPPE